MKKRGKISKRKAATLLEYAVAIALLLVLVVLVVWFTTGKFIFGGDFLSNLIGGDQINVQNVVSGCSVACNTGNSYEYCLRTRDILFEKGSKKEQWTCARLVDRVPSVGLSKCDNIACTGYDSSPCSKYGGDVRQSCGSGMGTLSFDTLTQRGLVCCVVKKPCGTGGFGGKWTSAAKCSEEEYSATSTVIEADAKNHQGEICCIPLK
ncbi:MAG: hypothetical protein Q8N99_04110 [Nanoarchaeota archaeon]|nr:hypothetical protein [Nanoarchaeota archaeon]